MKPLNPVQLGLRHVSSVVYDDVNGGWTVTTLHGFTFQWNGGDLQRLDELAEKIDAEMQVLKG